MKFGFFKCAFLAAMLLMTSVISISANAQIVPPKDEPPKIPAPICECNAQGVVLESTPIYAAADLNSTKRFSMHLHTKGFYQFEILRDNIVGSVVNKSTGEVIESSATFAVVKLLKSDCSPFDDLYMLKRDTLLDFEEKPTDEK